MLTVAIVEDDVVDAGKLRACLESFSVAHGVEFDIRMFEEPTSFLQGYRPQYDMVFLDIEMPNMNGMDVARRLRDIDSDVILFFVTNMVQFAAKGYEVAAFDYVIKPLVYPNFERKLERAVKLRIQASNSILVLRRGGAKRILLRDIAYIEVRGHALLFQTESGTVTGSGTLQDAQSQLERQGFLRCSKAFLVNYRRISAVNGQELLLDTGQTLMIGRAYRKSFMQGLANRIGDGNSA